jgi:hypothetical protein
LVEICGLNDGIVRSIYISKIFNALANEFDDGLMFSLSAGGLFLQLAAAALLQVVDIQFHPLEHLLLGIPDLLQLPLQQQHLALEFVDQTHRAALPLLPLP